MRIMMFFLFLCLQVSAQEIRLPKGVVIDSLPIKDTVNESYSLYLPMEFQPEGPPMPVLFILDSEGRGKPATQLFQPAAREQGYILAASNNINSDNSYKQNVQVAARLINGVTSTIPVDLNSISVAGYSEGARVATSIPLIFNNIQGVIAVGSHQLNFDFLDNKNKKRFSFVGVVGDEEFSSYGMYSTAAELNRRGFPSAVYTFEGGHEWPNPGIIASAVGSLTLQAMRDGRRPVDPSIVDSLFDRDLSRVNSLISNGEYFMAYNLLELMQTKYEGFKDLTEVKDKQKQLGRSRNFIDQRNKMREVQQKEERLIDDFIYYYNEDVATANFENLGWWNYQKIQLEELTKGGNELEADMAQRLMGMLNQLARMKREELEAAPNAPLESELLANMIQTIFDQTNFRAYKRVISLSAQDRDYSTALFYLEEMLKNGFDNRVELYDLEGALALSMTPEFNWLVKKYLGSSKYYDVEDKIEE